MGEAQPKRAYNVLFLCTGNSARSDHGRGDPEPARQGPLPRFQRRQPSEGQVNPIALEQLRNARLPTEGLRSKSWDEFAAAGRAGARLRVHRLRQRRRARSARSGPASR